MKQNNPITLTKTNNKNNLKTNLIPETMKTKMNFLKTAIMAIALMGAAQVSAQTYPAPSDLTIPITSPADLGVGTMINNDFTSFISLGTPADNAALFYKPNTTNTGSETEVTLTATGDDNGTAPGGIDFVSYKWYRLTTNGTTETPVLIPGETAQTLVRPNLPAGYHKFRVYGEVGTTTVCPSIEYQDIIVFVLPELTVNPTVTGETYCEDAMPATINLSTTVSADYSANTNGFPQPAASDFDLIYEWFYDDGSGPQSLTTSSTSTVAISNLPNTPGTYDFSVKVQYESTIRPNNADGVTARPYVIYEGVTDGTITEQIVVTETPGTPTISVTGVTD